MQGAEQEGDRKEIPDGTQIDRLPRLPDDTGCTLYLSGEEEHVVRAAAEHAISVHGQEDTLELRKWLHDNLKDEVEMAHA